MTEAEWLACTEPRPMLLCLAGQTCERKLRLFLVACARRALDRHVRIAGVLREAVLAAEQAADPGQVLWQHGVQLSRMTQKPPSPEVPEELLVRKSAAAFETCLLCHCITMRHKSAADLTTRGIWIRCRSLVEKEQPNWLRDIFGYPFRPVAADPAWLTSTAVSLATAIYADRAFDRLPILADALEDAGCDNADILNHCRLPGEHVRGCWVVDLLLDKK